MQATFGKRRAVTAPLDAAPAGPTAQGARLAPATVASPAEAGRLTAFVLSSATAPPDLGKALIRAQALWPAMPTLAVAGGRDGAHLLLDESGSMTMIMFVAGQYPLAELQPLLRSAIGWPSIVEDLNAHRSHAVISVSHPDPARAHMILTFLTAAILEDQKGTGVLWADTFNLIPARDFLKHCSDSSDARPPLLWTKVDLVEGTDSQGRPGLLAFTRGLSGLGLLDYELVCSKEQFRDFAFTFLYGSAADAISRGSQEEDGRVKEVGKSPAGGRIGVRFRRQSSIRGGDREVIGLKLVAM
jgi:hypothetical protein